MAMDEHVIKYYISVVCRNDIFILFRFKLCIEAPPDTDAPFSA